MFFVRFTKCFWGQVSPSHVNSTKWAPSLGRTGVGHHHQPLHQNSDGFGKLKMFFSNNLTIFYNFIFIHFDKWNNLRRHNGSETSALHHHHSQVYWHVSLNFRLIGITDTEICFFGADAPSRFHVAPQFVVRAPPFFIETTLTSDINYFRRK